LQSSKLVEKSEEKNLDGLSDQVHLPQVVLRKRPQMHACKAAARSLETVNGYGQTFVGDFLPGNWEGWLDG
jgi:hypothetical protein